MTQYLAQLLSTRSLSGKETSVSNTAGIYILINKYIEIFRVHCRPKNIIRYSIKSTYVSQSQKRFYYSRRDDSSSSNNNSVCMQQQGGQQPVVKIIYKYLFKGHWERGRERNNSVFLVAHNFFCN